MDIPDIICTGTGYGTGNGTQKSDAKRNQIFVYRSVPNIWELRIYSLYSKLNRLKPFVIYCIVKSLNVLFLPRN